MCGICFRIIQGQGEGQEWIELQMKDFPSELIIIEAGRRARGVCYINLSIFIYSFKTRTNKK